MILLRRPRYQPNADDSEAVAFMRTRIEPYMRAINDELRKAGLVGPGRDLAIHVTSQSEDLRLVIQWREDE